MSEVQPKQPCSTCGRAWSAAEFYATGSECKPCKRRRSRRNRAIAARKLAAFERFVDVLVDLADQRPTNKMQPSETQA